MKNTLFIFLFLWSATAFTQVDKIKIKKEETEKPKEKPKQNYNPIISLDLVYGQKIYAKNFYKQLNTFDSLDFNLPTKFIGFGFSNHSMAVNPRGNYGFCMYFNFILPQSIKVQDTIHSKLQGFDYNLGWGWALHGSRRILTLGIFLGFNTGVTQLNSAELGKQINPFFSPKVALQPRLAISRFTFSLIFDCGYDVSNPAWKSFKSSRQSESIKGFNQTGLSLLGSIGWGIH